MMTREQKARVARATLAILKRGHYRTAAGQIVRIQPALRNAIAGTRLYRPGAFTAIAAEVRGRDGPGGPGCSEGLGGAGGPGGPPVVEVTPETTLGAARRLHARYPVPCVLNFASARRPGGGFRAGSVAQEESLARASGLYPYLARMEEMYAHNRARRTKLSSNYMVYSPAVPVFRDDEDALLARTYCISIISAPAVNKGALAPAERPLVAETMIDRIEKILLLAIARDTRAIVLGAYGCGVFKNAARDVARYFHEVLVSRGHGRHFEHVTFAIHERSKARPQLAAFRAVFPGPHASRE